MENKGTKKVYLFLDESGDPKFFAKKKQLLAGKEGFQPLLMLGMVQTENKKELHDKIKTFQDEILNDAFYNCLPCIQKNKFWYFHAKDDNLEIRAKFVDFIRKLDNFESYIVIGRKKLDLFEKKHNSNPTEFYFDLVSHLLKDRLNNPAYFYQLYLAARDANSQERFKMAINQAIEKDNRKRKIPIKVQFNCEIVRSELTPELSLTDYLLWALQRYILQKDERYYKALIDKFNLIIDLYDFDKISTKSGSSNYYTASNIFSLEKCPEFRIDGYMKK